MKYGTLTNNTLTPAPRRITLDGWQILNPTPEQLAAAGYKPVVYTDTPEAPEGYYAESYWTETAEAIVQAWRLEELPPEEPEAPVWDVWQGRHFVIGDRCRVDERTFRAYVEHDAAWNKRPITGANWTEYWEEVFYD